MQNFEHGGVVGLSPGQARFAKEHDATVGMLPAYGQREVFLYHHDPWATYRWLVDDDGRAVDLMSFRRSPPKFI